MEPTSETTPDSAVVEVEPRNEEVADEPDTDPDARRDERYRARLREAEADRDRWRNALLPRLRAEVERAAAERLTSGSSLWLLPGLDPLALVNDDLAVDAAKVATAVERLLEAAPQLAQRPADFDLGARTTTAPGSSWKKVLGGS